TLCPVPTTPASTSASGTGSGHSTGAARLTAFASLTSGEGSRGVAACPTGPIAANPVVDSRAARPATPQRWWFLRMVVPNRVRATAGPNHTENRRRTLADFSPTPEPVLDHRRRSARTHRDN